MAVRTSSIVAWAAALALFEPSRRMSQTISGRDSYSGRRAWIPARRSSMWAVRRALQSRQPIPALRQPAAAHYCVSRGEKALCKSKTGQTSGSPGSVRRLRAGSVTMGLSFSRTTAGASFM